MLAKRIGVLAGGNSPEREASLESGEQVHKALRELGYDSALLTIDTTDDIVPALAGIDIVFNVLHGGAGEDGTIALLLDVLKIAYPGSRAQACARAMNKKRTRDILSHNNILVPQGMVCTDQAQILSFCASASTDLGLPLIVKPIDHDSNIGVHIVKSEAELIERAEEVTRKLGSVLAEKYIQGRKLTAAILDMEEEAKVLPLVEVVPKGAFFDCPTKYDVGMAEFIVPALLDKQITSQVKSISLAAHLALGCSGYSLVDIRLTPDAQPYVLEVNTNPGMTELGDLPRAAEAAGIDFPDLVRMMLDTVK